MFSSHWSWAGNLNICLTKWLFVQWYYYVYDRLYHLFIPHTHTPAQTRTHTCVTVQLCLTSSALYDLVLGVCSCVWTVSCSCCSPHSLGFQRGGGGTQNVLFSFFSSITLFVSLFSGRCCNGLTTPSHCVRSTRKAATLLLPSPFGRVFASRPSYLDIERRSLSLKISFLQCICV